MLEGMRRVVAILVLIGLTVGSAFAYQYTVTDAPASLLPKGRIDPTTFVSLQRKDFASGAAVRWRAFGPRGSFTSARPST